MCANKTISIEWSLIHNSNISPHYAATMYSMYCAHKRLWFSLFLFFLDFIVLTFFSGWKQHFSYFYSFITFHRMCVCIMRAEHSRVVVLLRLQIWFWLPIGLFLTTPLCNRRLFLHRLYGKQLFDFFLFLLLVFCVSIAACIEPKWKASSLIVVI